MHNNFELLESKCKRYHLKKILKIALPVTLLFVVSIIGLFSFFTDEKELVIVKKEEIKTPTIVKIIDDADIFEEVKEKEKEKEPDIFQQVEEEVIKREDVPYDLHLYSYNLLNKKRDKVIHRVSSKRKIIAKEQRIHKVTKVKKISKKEIEPKVRNNSFSIVLKNLNSTDKMIEVYKKEKTYSIALKIAKLFYKQKKYKEAVIWSKKANNIDSRAEEAWLVYAKGEYALGHEKRAKGILKVYVNNSNSEEAKSLLISWLKGRKND